MKRYAILISCEDYKDFANISFCHGDALLIEETLVKYCDYERENVMNLMLYPSSDNNKPEEVLEKVRNNIENSEEGDTILFYFAGHGFLEGDNAYLLLPDTCRDNIPDTALSIKKLNKCLSKNNRANFRIFDACHSGIDTRGVKVNSFNDMVSGDGWITLASCAKDEESYPDSQLQQGIFTYCLVQSIREFKKGEFVFAEDLKLKVCNKMSEWCAKNYKKQTPTMNAAVSGNMPIAKIVNDFQEKFENNIEVKNIVESEGDEVMDKNEIIAVSEKQVICNNSNYLWESPSGVKLPKKADVDLLLSYNIQLKPKAIRQINFAYKNESYEMLASYIWDISMKLLQKKILGLGVEFVADMVGVDNFEYVNNLPPFEILNLALDLGFIDNLGKVRLKNNNELIQQYCSEETQEEMTEDQVKEIIRSCIQYILGQDDSNLNLEYNNFRENLKLELIEKNQEQLDSILNSPYFYKKTTVRTLMNLLKETDGTEYSNVAANMITIIPYIWEKLLSEERYFIGLNYAKYSNENNDKCRPVLKNVLMKVKGFDYVPENLKSSTFIEAAKTLMRAHFGTNNFYNEPKAAKDLSSLGTVIPKPALEAVITASLFVKMGNSYGISWAAQQYVDDILDSIHSEQWIGYFNFQFRTSEDILYKISSGNDQTNRWCDIVNKYKLDELGITNPLINKLLAKSREEDIKTVSSIAYKLYGESIQRNTVKRN